MKDISGEFDDKVVLVTGGAGAIGGNLVRELDGLAVRKILIYDDLSSSYKWNIPKGKKIRFIQADILDDAKLARAFREQPDIVYHLAAHFANQNSVDHPEKDLMVNGMGILKVLQQAAKARVARFVYSSSGCGVYGLDSRMPFEEHDVSIHLHTPYQVTKLLGELYTNYFSSYYHLPVVNARFFNSFGPGEVPGVYRNVIPNFFYWAMNGQSLPITGDGTETRDWTYVGDIVQGLLAMGVVEEAVGEAFNLGSGKEQRVIDMANRVNSLAKNTAGITFTERRAWDVKTRLLSCIDKSRNVLGYRPATRFSDGLKNTFAWFEANWVQIQKSAEF